MKNRFMAVSIAIGLLAAMITSIEEEGLRASALERHLNIETTFGTTETFQYGVPNAFGNRYRAITGKVASFYYVAFDIDLDFSLRQSPNYVVAAPIDQCKRETGVFDAICPHTTNSNCMNANPYHCSNATYNVFELNEGTSNIDKHCLHITAAKLCYVVRENGQPVEHTIANGLNTGIGNDRNIIVRDYDYVNVNNNNWQGDATNITWVAKTVAHEIGHLYNVEDHYNSNSQDDDPYCIWGEYKEWETVARSLTICDACYSTIMQNRNKYNHS